MEQHIKATTILSVRKGDSLAIAGDGQVSLGNTIMKHGANKVRRLYKNSVLAGFAGGAADAFALFDKFESQLEKHSGNLTRSAVEMAKEWRSDKVLRRLEALMIVADAKTTFIISGTGDVIEPDDGLCAIGSGGPYALAAARALAKHTEMGPAEIARESLEIASRICLYTNDNIHVEEL